MYAIRSYYDCAVGVGDFVYTPVFVNVCEGGIAIIFKHEIGQFCLRHLVYQSKYA